MRISFAAPEKIAPTVLKLSSLVLASSLLVLPSASYAGSVDKRKTGSVGSYASSTTLARSGGKPGNVDIKPASSTLKNGLRALDKRDMKSALRARSALRAGTLERKVMAWAIAMNGNDVSAETLISISNDLSNWPGSKTMRANVERALAKSASRQTLRVAFSESAPEDTNAAIAVAKAHLAAGAKKSARSAIAPHWRNSKLSTTQERTILKSLSSVLYKSDHRARVEYLLSKNRIRGAERIAGKAGVTSIVRARAAVERKQRSAGSLLKRVPASQRSDPNYLHSMAKYLRRKNQLSAAAKLLAPVHAKDIPENARDAFWTEKRILASDLLEAGAPKTAYRLVANNTAFSDRKKLDAEFYAGWLALRKLGAAKTATTHFDRLLNIAGTPLSKSRGHYWMGRALEKRGISKATDHYKAAARYDTTYYGQLAALKLGRTKISINRVGATSADQKRFSSYEFAQAISKLETAGHPRRARQFYRHLARYMEKPGEIALLAARAERRGDYQLSLQVGKRAFIRGMSADTLAWPLGAIPTNTKTSGAGLPLAYAIARQESTFQVDARSPANALGLLQLLPTTAKRTARNLGLRYSKRRLVTDASYNARLGTAYLKQQMDKYNGSFVLTFSAYNAGPSRANDWIKRFGDPRGKSLNTVIDWVEQIPFAETRNYVQRVMENYQVYKTRLKGGKLTISRDLRAGRS